MPSVYHLEFYSSEFVLEFVHLLFAKSSVRDVRDYKTEKLAIERKQK